jgi:hypothetical protein
MNRYTGCIFRIWSQDGAAEGGLAQPQTAISLAYRAQVSNAQHSGTLSGVVLPVRIVAGSPEASIIHAGTFYTLNHP